MRELTMDEMEQVSGGIGEPNPDPDGPPAVTEGIDPYGYGGPYTPPENGFTRFARWLQGVMGVDN